MALFGLFVGLFAALAGLAGCSDRSRAAQLPGEVSRQPAAVGVAAKPQGQQAGEVSIAGMRKQLDMLQAAHLAEVDQQGLHIDLGSAARFKYTLGDWKTGWGKPAKQGELSYSPVGLTGRLFFDVDRPQTLTLRFRMRPRGDNRVMMLFLNNKELPAVRFTQPEGFAVYDVQVPAEATVAGENQLLLRFDHGVGEGESKTAAYVASLRVMPAGVAAIATGPALPMAAWRKQVVLGGQARQAMSLPAPGTLRYHLQVPLQGRLFVGVGAEAGGTLRTRVMLYPEQGAPQQLFAADVGAAWREKAIDLRAFAGQVVRLDLSAEPVGGQPAGGKPGSDQPTEPRVAWTDLGLWTSDAGKLAPAKPAKHVVLLLVDTLRADKLKPFAPASRVRTPVLDEVAAQGTVFAAAQSPENYTKPSVASVLTGLYPMTHNVKAHEAKLPDSALMISEHYRVQGYRTGSFIANGYVSDRFGFGQGWDHYINYVRDAKSTKAEHVFADAAAWMEKNREKPMFVFIQTIDPHVPYDPPDAFLAMYDDQPYQGPVPRRVTADIQVKASAKPPKLKLNARDRARLIATYDGEISYHDLYMGKFIDKLKALGIWEETLFVFTSDHGEELGDHEGYGHGHSLYQELLHVPLMFRYPAAVPAGKRVDSVVGTIDIAPTITALTAAKPMPDAEGNSLVPWMRGEQQVAVAAAFSDFLDHRKALRVGRWKYELRGTRPSLYDLQKDEGETRELPLAEYAVPARACRALFGQFLGASDRRGWLLMQADGASKALKVEKAAIDPTLQNQLQQLGYGN